MGRLGGGQWASGYKLRGLAGSWLDIAGTMLHLSKSDGSLIETSTTESEGISWHNGMSMHLTCEEKRREETENAEGIEGLGALTALDQMGTSSRLGKISYR